MKNFIYAIVLTLFMVATANAEMYDFKWDAPTTNEDGTPLTDLAGYNLYQDGVKVADTGNVLHYVYDVPEGAHVYTVKAYDTSSNESKDSNTIIFNISICPDNPKNFNATKVEK